jgi:hypothetical protein
MSSREHHSSTYTCPRCGKKGLVQWSESEGAAPYSGSGRNLESIAAGFEEGPPSANSGEVTIVCSDCVIAAIG